MKLALVIGHGPKIDEGAESADGKTTELAWNRDFASRIARCMIRGPVECMVIHRRIERVQPVREVNASKADFCVELHCNAYDGRASGTEMIYHAGSARGIALATRLCKATVQVLQLPDRGVKTPQAGGRGGALLRGTLCPTVIAEPFFIDNDDDLDVANECKDALAMRFADVFHDFAMSICP